MSDPVPPSDLPRTKSRLPFEQKPFGGAVQRSALLVYGALVVGLVGLAAYMALIEHRPLVSGWVAAPAIGAAWFALRFFMMLGPRR